MNMLTNSALKLISWLCPPAGDQVPHNRILLLVQSMKKPILMELYAHCFRSKLCDAKEFHLEFQKENIKLAEDHTDVFCNVFWNL